MPPAPRVPVIFNPSARSEKGAKLMERVRGFSAMVDLLVTSSFDEASALAAKAAEEGCVKVVAAGGDGTVNAVIAGLAGSETALGILPTGTMNLFARELGLPVGELEECWRVVEVGRIREVDLFSAGDGLFVQVAGVGFDAQIIEETTWERKKKFGPLSYLMSAMSVVGQPPPRLKVFAEGADGVDAAFVLIGNGALYGPAFKVFRHASNSDGLLEVLMFEKQGHLDMLRYLSAMAMGKVENNKDVTYLQTPWLRVESEEPAPVEVDGELAGTTPVEFEALPTPLRTLVP